MNMSTYEEREQERLAFYFQNPSISSDDADALTKLRQKCAYLEQEKEDMKRLNAAYRKGKWEGLAELSEVTVASFKRKIALFPWQYENCLFAGWELSNLGAQIRQTKRRIIALEDRQSYVPPLPVSRAGCCMIEDVEDNRIHLQFDSKPDASIRNILKQHGFRWSPNRSAWVRMLNNQGRYAAKEAITAIENYPAQRLANQGKES